MSSPELDDQKPEKAAEESPLHPDDTSADTSNMGQYGGGADAAFLPAHWPGEVIVALVVFILFSTVILLALPVRDADLWWQMAQGRYLLTEGKLAVDQTVFSWTPAHGSKTLATVYCAWIAQIFFHLMFLAGGLPLLFSFRYFCFILFLEAVAFFAWKRGIWRHPLVWLACLVAFLMSHSAAGYLKPEIFSFVYMTTAIALWLGIKSSKREPWKWCYCFPALMLIWVNTHGGFLVGTAFLILVGLGETANALWSPQCALPRRVRKHLFIAISISFAMTLITPYGWMYIKETIVGQLIGYEGDEKTIGAYLSIFTGVGIQMHLIEYLIVSGGLVISLLIPQIINRRIDWALILNYAAFTLLYTVYLRTTYFGGIIFVFTFLYLLSQKDSWEWITNHRRAGVILTIIVGLVAIYHGLVGIYQRVTQAQLKVKPGEAYSYIDYYNAAGAGQLLQDIAYPLTIALVCAFIYFVSWTYRAWMNTRFGYIILALVTCCFTVYLSRQAIHDRIYEPRGSDWMGFGIGYYNAVEETEYIKHYLPETKRVGNDYVSGGYLMWSLYPQTKVMIDPRHFPFHSWYREYRSFVTGSNIPGFLKSPKYACDVWCINFRYKAPIDWFTVSSEYKLAFYGARAAIFVKKHVKLAVGAPTRGDELSHIRSSGRALSVLKFALNKNDWEGALIVLNGMKKNFSHATDLKSVTAADDFLYGVFAFIRRDYEESVQRLESAKSSKIIWSDGILLKSYIQLVRQQWIKNLDTDALESAKAALKLSPKDLINLFNLGVIEWFLQERKEDVQIKNLKIGQSWRIHLETFVKATSGKTKIPQNVIRIAKGILAGTYQERPPLLYQNEPSPALGEQLKEIIERQK
jgi:hypothetical protein